MRRPGFQPQITVHVDSDGVDCLRFIDDAKSKTNQGGLGKVYIPPKEVFCYRNVNPSRCLCSLYKKYISSLPESRKNGGLFLNVRRKPTPQCWYIDSPTSINSLGPFINRLYKLAGFTKGKFVNRHFSKLRKIANWQLAHCNRHLNCNHQSPKTDF